MYTFHSFLVVRNVVCVGSIEDGAGDGVGTGIGTGVGTGVETGVENTFFYSYTSGHSVTHLISIKYFVTGVPFGTPSG